MKILLIGGAGYIGSTMYYHLRDQGDEVIILDNLSTGHAALVPATDLVIGDFADTQLLTQLVVRHKFDAVMHFAALSIVSESVQDPLRYYHNNVAKTMLLLTTLAQHGIQYIIFSSTAAVYGQPEYLPIDIYHPTKPINPYGMSKLMVEKLLAQCAQQYGLKYAALRYFNAAGADLQQRCGECHQPETHLIPRILQALSSSGQRKVQVFGDQYPTRDGTCERDYIHVCDLARAHYLALTQLQQGSASASYNLGTGQGYTVKEIIDAAARVTGEPIQIEMVAPRSGDPAALVAKPDANFAWRCERSDIDTIIADAWRWEQVKGIVLDEKIKKQSSVIK